MAQITTMSISDVGRSMKISLPKEWIVQEKIKKGEKLTVIASGRAVIVISPHTLSRSDWEETIRDLKTLAEIELRKRGLA